MVHYGGCSKDENQTLLTSRKMHLAMNAGRRLDSTAPLTRCPWVLRTEPGRKINVTAYNFALSVFGGSDEDDDIYSNCPMYITIEERIHSKQIDACSLKQKKQVLYSSSYNQIQIVLSSALLRKALESAVLSYTGE